MVGRFWHRLPPGVRVKLMVGCVPLWTLLFATLMSACDSGAGKPQAGKKNSGHGEALARSFSKPVIRLALSDGSGHNLLGIKDCHVYKARAANGAIAEWKLLFQPAFYPLPTACIKERLEMDGGFLHIEIGTQAIGAGGCCTTYAAYRTVDGEAWEVRPATSVTSWQSLDMRK